jgi:FMN phosphatase YigB (HAD superfamily)
MKRDVIIVDLDGTLCNSSHRDHLAQQKLWDEFNASASADEPWEDVAVVIKAMQLQGFKIYGLTGRSHKWHTLTVGWLIRNGVHLDALMMRPEDDYTSDHDLKPKMLAAMFGDIENAKGRVLFILEDRDKVVEAWRNLGFRCWQVQPGGY